MSTYKPIERNGDVVDYSDGYHTFTELYAHRVALWIQLTKLLDRNDNIWVWRTKYHSDGGEIPNWFLLGVTLLESGQQLSYHLPDSEWGRCYFAAHLPKAPPFDGHTSQDVLERLNNLP